MSMDKMQDFPQKLLVEGKTDQHIVWALCEHYHVAENFNVRDCDGIDKLMEILSMMLTNPTNVKTIGIIVDADNRNQQGFQVLRVLLRTIERNGQCLCEE